MQCPPGFGFCPTGSHSFSIRLLRFMDAYRKRLDGKQATWASKKFHRHPVLPETIMKDLVEAGLGSQIDRIEIEDIC
ncbi:hypothetical protein BDR07DRAFT_18423 [Suillus spraguei]|nr:hypothetical protein BDR07DRAFT_18423 [Suillus spraguei]